MDSTPAELQRTITGSNESSLTVIDSPRSSLAPELTSFDKEERGEKLGLAATALDDKEILVVESVDGDADGVRLIDGVEVVGLKGSDDVFSPLNLQRWRKWFIVFLISMGALCVTCASSMAPSTYLSVEAEFDVSPEVTILSLSLFVLGLGFVPMVLSPMSEFFGRMPIYTVGYTLFIVFNFMTAFSNNTTTFLIARFFTGASGSAFVSVAGGTVSDMFIPSEVGAPMALFTSSLFMGPALGPLISSFINGSLYWRWTWYIMLIWACFQWIALVFLVPETFLPSRLKAKAVMLRKRGRVDVKAPIELDTRSIMRVVLTRVRIPVALLAKEPMALLLCIASAILLGIIYMFFSAFDIIYGAYGFTKEQVGLAFIGQIIGVVIGTLCHPIFHRYYMREADRLGRRPPPEEHLRRGVVGAILLPISLFAFAFTTYPSVPWPVSVVVSIFFGMAIIFTYQAVFTFLVDAYRPVAASAMAANSFLRASFAAGFPLFTTQMYTKLGTQGATSLCAGLTLVFFPVPFFLFFKYGARLRKGSKFAQQDPI